jgi:hypothetical protein
MVKFKNSFRRGDPETCTEKVTIEFGKIVIAGIKLIRGSVHLVGGEIISSTLLVESVEWSYR